MSEQERAILRATEELYSDAMISDATWTTLAQHLNTQQLIELPIVVGHIKRWRSIRIRCGCDCTKAIRD